MNGALGQIEFYDTRTRTQRPFEPLEPGHVRIYTCGPTVYAEQHVGNLRSRLFSDLLKRFLISPKGFEVTHVINITDVGHLVSDADEGEDKMEAAARKAGQTAEEIAAHYTELWRQDGEAVNCLPPGAQPEGDRAHPRADRARPEVSRPAATSTGSTTESTSIRAASRATRSSRASTSKARPRARESA